ncbi:MAG: serine hydrolase [Ruminococcus sp.]|nr:serine hydrolase [Ruminococcus sp.]
MGPDKELEREFAERNRKRRLISKKRLIKQWTFLGAAVAVIMGATVIAGGKKADKPVKNAPSSSQTSEIKVRAAVDETPAAPAESKAEEKPDDLSDLKKMLEDKIAPYTGEWSVYVKNLDTDKSITINNRPIYPASIIKLFALGAAYQQINDGIFVEETLYPDLEQMAVHSNNVAFNNIVWDIGKTAITDWCRENGYKDTEQNHGLNPADNAEGLATSDKRNVTTVEDVGKMMESIYRGECVSKVCSARMLNFMLDQEYRDKLPAGIPRNVMVANKTGETDDVSHDAAIVYSPACDYIIVVMVDAPDEAWDCFGYFSLISADVYGYFNPGT